MLGHPDKNLTFPVQLACNGRSVSVTALGDTGANGFIFIDTNLALILCKSLGLRTIRLPHECPVQGFNGRPGSPITHAVVLTLLIDGRTQRQIPMLVVDLGRHDVILGRMWFEQFNTLPDCRNRRIVWPDEPTVLDEPIRKCPEGSFDGGSLYRTKPIRRMRTEGIGLWSKRRRLSRYRNITRVTPNVFGEPRRIPIELG
jgi:predicted aspartyl protease